MPSVPESGNTPVVDNKSRPTSLKVQEASKYTDVKRTSSASFKPPMSKDPVIKKKVVEVPQPDTTWFGPISYIKSMFGGKSTTDSTIQVPTKSDKNSKARPPTKNVSHVTKLNSSDSKEDVQDTILNKDESRVTHLKSVESHPPPSIKAEHSPGFSFTAEDATGGRRVKEKVAKEKVVKEKVVKEKVVKEKVVLTKQEPEDIIDPNAPKYNALRFVDNKSTYLHTPEKKGTTSFRITTSSKVKNKPIQLSPQPVNTAKKMRKSPVSNRKSSASPKKIPQSDSNTAINFPTRLRSKSTPDHSSFKPRPVSDTTYPKSLSLKPTSQKTVKSCQNDVNENKSEVAFVKPPSKQSLSHKPPSIDGNKLVSKLSIKKTSSRSSKSSVEIDTSLLPTISKAARSSSVGDNPSDIEPTQDPLPTRRVKITSSVAPPKSNPHRQIKPQKQTGDAKVKEPPLTTKERNLEKKTMGTKAEPILEIPTFTHPSLASLTVKKPKANPKRTQCNGREIVAKFVNAQLRAKEKLKERMDKEEEIKIQGHQMVLTPAVQSSPTLYSWSGQVKNKETSPPDTEIVLKRGKSESTRDISSTIAESAIRRPSPPGVICLTSNTVPEKIGEINQEKNMKITIEENETKHVPVELSFVEPIRSPTIVRIESSADPSIATYPTNTGNSSQAVSPDVESKSNATSELLSEQYTKSKEIDEPATNLFYSVCTEQLIPENIYHSSTDYHDKSNSASCCDDNNLEWVENMVGDGFKIDVFCDDFEKEQDTCNSAFSRKSVVNKKQIKSIGTGNIVYEVSDGPSVFVSNDGFEGDVLPFQNKIGENAINFFTDESSATAAKGMEEKSAKPPGGIPVSKERGTRKTPFDDNTAENEEPEREEIETKTIVLKNPSIKAARSGSANRVHPSPFVNSSTQSRTEIGGSNYLNAINRSILPTVQEPSLYGEGRKTKRSQSPTMTPLSAFASSVGEAIDTIKKKFGESFGNKSDLDTTDGSPVRSEIKSKNAEMKPTKMMDKPMSATVTYIKTFLEDKGLSPLPYNKSVEKKKSEPQTQEGATVDKSKKLPSPSPVSSSIGRTNNTEKIQTPKLEEEIKTNTLDIKPSTAKTQTKEKKQQVGQPKISPANVAESKISKTIVAETNISPESKKTQSTVAELKDSPETVISVKKNAPIIDKAPLSPVTARISKTIEDTKKLLATMFSPPKTTTMPKIEKSPSPKSPEVKWIPQPPPETLKKDTKEKKVSPASGKNNCTDPERVGYDSSPLKWPTITKPGFTKIGKSSPPNAPQNTPTSDTVVITSKAAQSEPNKSPNVKVPQPAADNPDSPVALLKVNRMPSPRSRWGDTSFLTETGELP